jgi:predicted nucleotidyltransferase
MKIKLQAEVLREARAELRSHKYKFPRPYLFGSMIDAGYSAHDADIFIPLYKSYQKIPGALVFQKKLSERLGGFPINISTYVNFHLKPGQTFHPQYRRQHWIRI